MIRWFTWSCNLQFPLTWSRHTAGQIVANVLQHTAPHKYADNSQIWFADSFGIALCNSYLGEQTYSNSCSTQPNGCIILQHTALGQIVAVYCNTQHHTNSQTIRRNDSLIHSESHSANSIDMKQTRFVMTHSCLQIDWTCISQWIIHVVDMNECLNFCISQRLIHVCRFTRLL